MAKSFLIVGLGKFGSAVALTLVKLGHQVMAVDRNIANVNAIKDQLMNVAQCDMTNEAVVNSLGVSEFDAIIIGVGNDLRSSVLATVLCAEHGAKEIVCKAQDDLQEKLLLRVGATQVVQPERNAGEKLANSLVSESVLDYLNLSENYSINEIRVPSVWVGKTLGGIDVRKNYGVSVFAIRRGEEIIISMSADTVFSEGEVLVLVGENRLLSKVAKL
ncbi:MAG: TrkA family potassium uptake protein [Eubacteriales bacterium]|nr:TrkA family potassium uptake protein [Eubacteriales bacterium]